MSSVSILGQREQGQDVRTNNITAVIGLANIVKSSLGPQGLDKMLVDSIGDVTITNDGATILSQLEVEHPAAKVLVELANLQDKEVGDGTTSVVILASELLKRANQLVKNKIHPTTIMSGYRLALKEMIKYIKDNLTVKVDTLGRDALISAAKTSMSSKIVGSESAFFAEMVVSAMERVKTVDSNGKPKVPVKNVNILKVHGKSSKESTLVNGYAIEMSRSAQGMPTFIENAKIACVAFNLNKFRLHMGIQVLVKDPANLEKIRQKEMDVTKERVKMIINSGANVVLCTGGIDDFALKYFVEAGVMAFRRVGKADMRRIAKATGATVVTNLSDFETADEEFNASNLGECKLVEERRVGDFDYVFFEELKETSCQTIVIRGANEFFLEEVDRSLHDSLCVVKRILESNAIVTGGGAVEAALSVYLDDFARTLESRELLAIAEVAEALLIIPKTLAINAALDATDLVAKLKVFHHASQTSDDQSKRELKHYGLDLLNGKVRNNMIAGVLEPALSKVKSLKFAIEAAIAILRVDDMIRIQPKLTEDEKMRLAQRQAAAQGRDFY
jgi:T-complex protein 1 subunit alpha